MAEALLLREDTPGDAPNKQQQPGHGLPNYGARLKKHGIAFRMGACTDDQLADVILKELKRRKVDVAHPTITGAYNHIALISEWDSDWGRLVPLTMAACIRRESKQFEDELAASTGQRSEPLHRDLRTIVRELTQEKPPYSWPEHFHFFSYLRGLDGKIAGKTDSASPPTQKTEKGPGADAERNGVPIDVPVGPSQIDSIPRLTESLKSLERILMYHNKGRIRAIGILGSDVYDKLLILQAVRKHFPDVLVFTTDLDARYWHPSELKATRNLLVASSFGLQLHPELQGLAPPFRDSRQTALFNATMAALLLPDGKQSRFSYYPFQMQPRLFEIGYSGPINLSPPTPQGIQTERALHPPVRTPLSERHFVWWLSVAGGILAVIVAIWVLLRLLPRLTPEDERAELEKHLCVSPQDIDFPVAAQAVKAIRDAPNSGKQIKKIKSKYRHLLNLPQTSGLPLEKSFLAALNEYVQKGTPIGAETDKPDKPWPNGAWLHSRRYPGIWRGHFGAKLQRRSALSKFIKEMVEDASHVQSRGRLIRRKKNTANLPDPDAWPPLQAVTPLLDFHEQKLRGFDFLHAVTLISFLVLGVLIACDHFRHPSEGEPFALFQGISSWPTEILLLSSVLLSAYLWRHGYFELRHSFFDLARQFRLPLLENSPSNKPSRSASETVPCTAKNGVSIWREYQKEYQPDRYKFRVLPWALLFGLGGWIFLLAFSFPYRPTRGPWNERVDAILLLLSLLTSGWLTFFVWDASSRCRKLIRNLTPQPGVKPVEWPIEVTGRITDRAGIQDAPVYEWFNIHIIATHTKALDRFVFYPFLVLGLLTLAHSPIFDRWTLWQPAVLLLLLNAIVALVAVIQLTRAARTARNGAVSALRDRVRARFALQSADVPPFPRPISGEKYLHPPKAEIRVNLLESLIKDLEGMTEGAFAKLSQRPALSAVSIFCAAWLFRLLDFATK